jgi:hypothetical protein
VIAGYMVDIADPQDWNFTGTSVIPERHHELPRCNAIYIGGNTPHVYTAEQISLPTNEYRLPIWVYGKGRNAKSDALAAIDFVTKHGMPKGKLICLDMETTVDMAYSSTFHNTITAAGFGYVVYESESVSGNFVGSNGRWGAEWNKVIHIAVGDWATQYASASMIGHPFDISAVSSFSSLWQYHKPPVVKPPPPPVILQAVIVFPSLITQKVLSTDGKTWTTQPVG